MIKRVIWIVLDSVGMGELPDAALFGDQGSNTIGNISKAVGGLKLPNLVSLGLGNIDGIQNIDNICSPKGVYGRFAEKSQGKDTTVGHWEMAGVISDKPFPVYPDGFPDEIIKEFEKQIGTKIIGNKVASGTQIIEELGEEHVNTGFPILYTSADSVFQIAAHEKVIPIERLYEICKIARNILTGEHAVARVIARPFTDSEDGFVRTSNRRDFSLNPPYDTILDKLKKENFDVIAVGKIEDIFSKQGITQAVHTKDNYDGVIKTIEYMNKDSEGLIYTNLVDFDMKWGHRNDYKAYAKGLEDFDVLLADILSALKQTDILFITADHGCDPTTESTDHSREYVPYKLRY
jgi:phosphopentomutase